MFCGMRYRMLRPLGGVLSLVTKNKTQTLLLRNEAQLNCVALRPPLDYEVAWRAVQGQDERPNPAPLTALHAHRTQPRRCRRKTNMEGRHVGLDFYDLLIEVYKDNPVRGSVLIRVKAVPDIAPSRF